MLEIGPAVFSAFSEKQRIEQFPRMCEMLSMALAGAPGLALNIRHEAVDRQRITELVLQAEASGLDGERDIFAFGLMNADPHFDLPTETREWIQAVLVARAPAWTDKLDAIHALLPEPTRSLLFPRG